MILFHDEVESGRLMPSWMSVDEYSIKTPREVWEGVREKGWRVKYHRIPIAPDTPIEVSSISDRDLNVAYLHVGQLP